MTASSFTTALSNDRSDAGRVPSGVNHDPVNLLEPNSPGCAASALD